VSDVSDWLTTTFRQFLASILLTFKKSQIFRISFGATHHASFSMIGAAKYIKIEACVIWA